MYIPPHFIETRPEEIDRIIHEHPLGTLTYLTPHGLDATHLPFLHKTTADGRQLLLAHVARQNPLLHQIPPGAEVLTIFHGPQAYISPNWYPSKHETHRHVPTWDYQVVHVKGRVRFIDDVKYLRSLVALTTHIHETRTGDPAPWKLSDGEPAYIAQLLEAIVALEIEITSKTGATKMSQNREPRDRQSVIAELERHGHPACAHAVHTAPPPPPQD